MPNDVIAQSEAEAIIQAPAAAIDLAEWVFTLTDAEYQACSKDHIAAATTRTADGKRMSINVEKVGNLLVQHYVEDIGKPGHVLLVSESDSFGPTLADRARVRVTWEFRVEAIDDGTTRFVNRTAAYTLPGYREGLESKGIPFEKASAASTAAMEAHNHEETPLFAADIGRKAAEGRWG